MIIKIVLMPEKNEKEIETQKNSTVLDILKKLDLNPDTVLVIKDNTTIPVDEKLEEKNRLKIVKVVSGG